LLLLAVVVSVAALYGLYRFGQAGKTSKTTSTPTPELGDRGLGEIRMASGTFSHVVSDKGKTIFTLDGDSYQTDPNQQIFIRGMHVQLFVGEEVYTLASKEAYFNPLTDDVTLLEEVTVSSKSGLQLSTSSLQLRQKGRLLRGDERLQFVYKELAEGEAETLRIHLHEKLYLLSGDVWMQSLPGAAHRFSLHCERLLFDQVRHHVRSDGGAILQFDDGHLQGQRLSLFLNETETFPKFIRALWGVEGWIKLAASGLAASQPARRLDYSGRSLSINFEVESTSPRQFELEGSKRKQARVLAKASPPALPSQTELRARYLVGHFENGLVAGVEGWSDVVLVEALPADPSNPIRRVSGRRATAFFTPTGDLEQAVFNENVTFLDATVEANADRATFHFAQLTGEFVGTPVHLKSDRGTLSGPVVRYDRRQGLLHATGGTRSQLTDEAGGQLLEGSPLGRGEGPIWIEADEAYLRQQPRGFLFRGAVKAWRGSYLVLADSLLGKEEEQSLVAEGHVRTVGQTVAKGEAKQPETTPIEVTAERMQYLHAEGTLAYSGSVRSLQGRRVISCQELNLKMNPDGGAERMLCEEEVEILDPASGTTITGGDSALFQIGAGEIDVRGNPVRLKDAQGRIVTGKRMIYDLESGTFRSGASLPNQPPTSEDENR